MENPTPGSRVARSRGPDRHAQVDEFPDRFQTMMWILSILGIAALLGLVAALVWVVREIQTSTAAVRLERRLNPVDVLELDRAFARIQRDVLFGD